MIAECKRLTVWLQTNWKEISRADKRELKRVLEYRIQCGLTARKEKAVRNVLSLLRKV